MQSRDATMQSPGRSGAVSGRSGAVPGRSNAVARRSNAVAGRIDAVAGRSDAVAGRSDAVAGRNDAVAGLNDALPRLNVLSRGRVAARGPCDVASLDEVVRLLDCAADVRLLSLEPSDFAVGSSGADRDSARPDRPTAPTQRALDACASFGAEYSRQVTIRSCGPLEVNLALQSILVVDDDVDLLRAFERR